MLARCIAASALLALPLVAQRPIFVVDAAGGAGSQFTDLPQAVAAVPDGSVLLVRPGAYAPFSVSGKGLSIIGQRNPVSQVTVSSGTLDIGGTTATQTFLIRDVYLGDPPFGGVTVVIRGAQGAVIWDNVRSGGPTSFVDAIRFEIVHCDNIQLHGCQIERPLPAFGAPASLPRIDATDSTLEISQSTVDGIEGTITTFAVMPGTSALRLLRCRCVTVASSLNGGHGYGGSLFMHGCGLPPSAGGDGVVVDQSSFLALRTTVAGGFGASLSGCGAAPGGLGIVVQNSGSARFEGSAPVGSGPFSPGAFSTSSGGTIQIDASTIPSAGDLLGTQRIGQVVQFALTGAPQSLGVLLFANDPTLQPLEPIALGSFLSATVLSAGPFFIPASGTGTWPFGIPASYPLGETYYWQFVTIEPVTNRLWVTNSFALHVSS